MLSRYVQRGDTIIEVMLASAIFSMVAIGGLVVMNQGTAAAQRTLELNLVRQEMNSQAETLRFMHAASIAERTVSGSNSVEWNKVLAKRSTASATKFGALSADNLCPNTAAARNFVVNPRTAQLHTANLVSPTSFSQLRFQVNGSGVEQNALQRVEGLWIEAVAGSTAPNAPGFTDFHIRACWYAPGQAMPITLGTIVRLYEP